MMLIKKSVPVLAVLLLSISISQNSNTNRPPIKKPVGFQLIILGTAQDGGLPHIGCTKTCCDNFHKGITSKKMATSFAIIDEITKNYWLFEATPDIRTQLADLNKNNLSGFQYPNGIFITHAHVGHYAGLMELGREMAGTLNLPVYTMPKMSEYLRTNGPWSQLIKIKNIELRSIQNNDTILLAEGRLKVVPFTVPHRDEYSETVGYKIITAAKIILFIPDIDKWQKWGKSIVQEVENCDLAFLDATFYDLSELRNKSMEEIPHPLIVETVKLFEQKSYEIKSKIRFIHFNHTNPLLWDTSAINKLKKEGFYCSAQGEVYQL